MRQDNIWKECVWCAARSLEALAITILHVDRENIPVCKAMVPVTAQVSVFLD